MSNNIWRCRCGKRVEMLTDENFGDCGCSDPVYGPDYFYMSKECADMLDEMDKDYDEQHKQLAEARADADHWKNECNALQRMAHEARAEIERLKATTIDASLLREKLAELAHNQWVGWMEYLFSKSKQVDGCVVIPAWANERWHRQVATRYADLSEEEKDSDRSEADKFLAVFNAQLAERDKLIEQMREALKAIDGIGREAGNARREDALRCFAIAAAALTAERGE